MDNTHDGFGIMDDSDLWELEDQLFKLFRLKEDSDTFGEINEAGYEEFYLYNREQLKTMISRVIQILIKR